MNFQQNNNFNGGFGGNNQNNGGDKPRTNFPINSVYGSDGKIDISIWISTSSVYTRIGIKQVIGKNPTTGATTYASGLNSQLPSCMLSPSNACAFLEATENVDASTLNFTLECKKGISIAVQGSPTQIKITVNNEKTGPGVVTLNAITVGDKNIHADWKNFLKYIRIGYNKAITNKLDPEVFAAEFGGDSDSSDDSVPFE